MDYRYVRALFNKKDSVLVIGAGRSGLAATKLLLKKGQQVILYDDKSAHELQHFSSFTCEHRDKLTTYFGTYEHLPITHIKAVILSPGVGSHHVLLQQAKKTNIPIFNEIDLATLFLPPHKMIGITGTNGKSTTTVMVESILKEAGKKTIACGNLGLPLCDLIVSGNDDNIEYFVVELSSFQLETLFLARLNIALIINITPDHLDRYASFEDYKNAKLNIVSLLKHEGCLVVNEDIKSPSLQQAAYFSAHQFGKGDFDFLLKTSIPGDHNKENAMAAAMVSKSLGIGHEHILMGLNNYKPLPHRCEIVGIRNGVTFINDSKGTTVAAVQKALSMHNAPIHLLLGGIEKGDDFSLLSQKHYPKIKGYYVFGRAKEKILHALDTPIALPCDDLAHAVTKANNMAQTEEIILLSPGCASYDQFNDYQHRGEVFINLVNGIL